jgi:hypothetical protein
VGVYADEFVPEGVTCVDSIFGVIVVDLEVQIVISRNLYVSLYLGAFISNQEGWFKLNDEDIIKTSLEKVKKSEA